MEGGNVSSVLLLGNHDIYNLEAARARAASCPTEESTGMITQQEETRITARTDVQGGCSGNSLPQWDLDGPQETSTELSLIDAGGVCKPIESDYLWKNSKFRQHSLLILRSRELPESQYNSSAY